MDFGATKMPKLNLTLKCEDVKISTSYRNNLVEVELTNIDSLDGINENDILNNFLDLRLLFDKIIEKDEDILHDYLIKSGYIFSKG